MTNSFSTATSPKRAVIAIHGWTGDISSMEPIAKSIGLPDTKWVIPHAPYISDKKGYTWFQGNDKIGWKYENSFSLLSKIISDLLEKGFTHQQLFMIGFSQGACFIMEYIIRQSFSIGGIIPIAGFIKDQGRFRKDITPESTQTRVLLLHGDKDDVIFPEGSTKAHKLFEEAGYNSQYHFLPAKHKIPTKAIPLIKTFILSDKIDLI